MTTHRCPAQAPGAGRQRSDKMRQPFSRSIRITPWRPSDPARQNAAGASPSVFRMVSNKEKRCDCSCSTTLARLSSWSSALRIPTTPDCS
ncbi:hypothetical protein STRIP9103_00651 [Streptomyces ipomoeae 91-03]|uniref:Uncharacterized protein n=1 Tax=Streptomyces ipomoeae 91-03 TaxID=698759 RepID=L1KZE2_9ACTN|nr:hypothetical protein STRIP9103_00651 [Streptomyces ipomoeae 91-03]